VVIKEVGEGSGGDKADGGQNTSGVQGSQAVAEKAVPSVVAIRTEAMVTGNFWFGSQVTSGAGSGVIISENGYIITNAHVVDGADSITVELSSGKSYKAELVGSYTNGDIAVVKIDASGLPAAAFASMETVHQGEPVYAIGNPEGNFSGSFTGGYLSALDRQIQVSVEGSSGNGYFGGSSRVITLDVLQFDAAVSPGNSGGGLFDADGNLIGIVCAKSSGSDSEGLGFAIPGDDAQTIATALMTDGVYRPEGGAGNSGAQENTNKAILGISAAYLDATAAQQYGYRSAGVYVIEISQQSTYEAGLRVGDRIISVDGTVIENLDTVTDSLEDKNPGDKVELLVERRGKTATLSITLVQNPNAK
jgi:serine protease Do